MKDWTEFFSEIDANDENKVTFIFEGFYTGRHCEDDFLELAFEDTRLLDVLHSALVQEEVLQNNNFYFEGEAELDLYEDLLGGIYFVWEVFKPLLETSLYREPLAALLGDRELNKENVKAALVEDKGKTMAPALTVYFDTLISEKPHEIYDLFYKEKEMFDYKNGSITLKTSITTTVGALKATLRASSKNAHRCWFERQEAEITLNNGNVDYVYIEHPEDSELYKSA
jgi:hypothetical protein